MSEESRGVIMVIDDEQILLNLTTHMLEREGYAVIARSNAASAVRSFRKEPNEVLAVLLDATMEGSEDAFYIMRAIRPYLPIILSSGYASETVRDRFLSDLAPTLLPKPYCVNELRAAIRRVLQYVRPRESTFY